MVNHVSYGKIINYIEKLTCFKKIKKLENENLIDSKTLNHDTRYFLKKCISKLLFTKNIAILLSHSKIAPSKNVLQKHM